MTQTERLIGLLFPFVACIIAGVILIAVPFIALFAGGPTWAIILTVAPVLPFFYAFASIGDLRQAYLLIHRKKIQDKTPFDFLFWLVVTDNPKRVQISTLILGACLIILYTIYLLFF